MKQELFDAVKSVVDSFGLDIYHIEFHKNVLKVLIEAKGNPLTVETCADVSRQLSAKLDAIDLIPHRYRLEVSSPGIERELFEPRHYKSSIGQHCQLITKQGQFFGKILEADNEKVKLAINGEPATQLNFNQLTSNKTVTIFYSDIKSGHLKVSDEVLFGRQKQEIGKIREQQ